jgi:ketosteroid isomerase-like protein
MNPLIYNMKYKILIALFLSAFIAHAHVSSQDHFQTKSSGKKNRINVFAIDSTTIRELERLSKVWMDAMLRHDSTMLNDFLGAEYRLQRWDGKVMAYRAIWLDNLYHHIKITHWEQTDIHAQVYGDVAIVTSLYSWAGTFHDKAFDSKGYLTDVWVRHNNHWQVVSRTNGTFEGSKTLYAK